MKFSFEGNFDELRELGVVLSRAKSDIFREVVVKEVEEKQEKLETAPADKPEIVDADSCIDPATGVYYEAYKDMHIAFDKLLDADKQDVVKDILAKYSSDGTYGGIPSGKWGKAEKEALSALKKKKKGAKTEPAERISVDKIMEKATAFVRQNKDINRPKLRELLNSYGVANLSSLKESAYLEFNKSLDSLIGGEA